MAQSAFVSHVEDVRTKKASYFRAWIRTFKLMNLANHSPGGNRRDASKPPSPPDGGLEAWLFLMASFLIEALVWGESQPFIAFRVETDSQGFPFSFGVFQDYYKRHEVFKDSPNIPAIGTCAMVS